MVLLFSSQKILNFTAAQDLVGFANSRVTNLRNSVVYLVNLGKGRVNNIPTMQFITGISRITQSKSYMPLFTQLEKLKSNRAKSLPTTEAPFQELSNRIYLTTPNVISLHRKLGNSCSIYVLAILFFLLDYLHTKGTIYTNTSIY